MTGSTGNQDASILQKISGFDKSRFAPVAACPATNRPHVATVVDHIVPHKSDERLSWDKSNWLGGVCGHCHSRKTALSDGRWG